MIIQIAIDWLEK